MSDQTGSWQPDPFGRHQYRYWDGNAWTDQVSNDGEVAVDPPDAADATGPADAGAPSTAGDAEPPATEGIPTTGWGAPAAPPAWGDAPPPDPTTSMSTAAGGAGGGFAAGGAAPATPGEPPQRSSGNKPAFIIGGILLLLVIGAGAYLLLSGDDDTNDEASRDALIADFQEEADVDRGTAECIVDALDDEIGMERVRALDRDPDSASSEEEAVINTAIITCSLAAGGDADADTDEDADEDADGEDTTDTTEGGSGGFGIDPDSPMMDFFIQGVMEGSNLTQEQATCFSREFLAMDDLDFESMMNDPEASATDPGFIVAMMEVVETCDIPLEQFMGGGGTMPGGFDDAQSYGDDPELDALWDACEAGDGEACDDLYLQTPVGSEYEEFALTCGGRVDGDGFPCA